MTALNLNEKEVKKVQPAAIDFFGKIPSPMPSQGGSAQNPDVSFAAVLNGQVGGNGETNSTAIEKAILAILGQGDIRSALSGGPGGGRTSKDVDATDLAALLNGKGRAQEPGQSLPGEGTKKKKVLDDPQMALLAALVNAQGVAVTSAAGSAAQTGKAGAASVNVADGDAAKVGNALEISATMPAAKGQDVDPATLQKLLSAVKNGQLPQVASVKDFSAEAVAQGGAVPSPSEDSAQGKEPGQKLASDQPLDPKLLKQLFPQMTDQQIASLYEEVSKSASARKQGQALPSSSMQEKDLRGDVPAKSTQPAVQELGTIIRNRLSRESSVVAAPKQEPQGKNQPATTNNSPAQSQVKTAAPVRVAAVPPEEQPSILSTVGRDPASLKKGGDTVKGKTVKNSAVQTQGKTAATMSLGEQPSTLAATGGDPTSLKKVSDAAKGKTKEGQEAASQQQAKLSDLVDGQVAHPLKAASQPREASTQRSPSGSSASAATANQDTAAQTHSSPSAADRSGNQFAATVGKVVAQKVSGSEKEERPVKIAPLQDGTGASAGLAARGFHAPQPTSPTANAPVRQANGNLQLPSGQSVPEHHVLDQVVRHLSIGKHLESSSISMQLHPKELGLVNLQLSVSQNKVKAHLLAQSQQVQEVLQRHLPQLREALQQQGLQLDHLQVSVGSQHAGDQGFFQHQQQQAQTGQQPRTWTPRGTAVPVASGGEEPHLSGTRSPGGGLSVRI